MGCSKNLIYCIGGGFYKNYYSKVQGISVHRNDFFFDFFLAKMTREVIKHEFSYEKYTIEASFI